MAISDLILQLQHATGPNNDLDISIGIVAGYKREVQMQGDDDQKARKVVWLYPKNGGEAPLPRFTESLEDAYLLARTLLPGCIGGVSWDEISQRGYAPMTSLGKGVNDSDTDWRSDETVIFIHTGGAAGFFTEAMAAQLGEFSA